MPTSPRGKRPDHRIFWANSYHVQRADVGIGPYGIVRYLTPQITIYKFDTLSHYRQVSWYSEGEMPVYFLKVEEK